eukprot:6268452-Alexandrium_andersonii.AAC.1
MSASLVGSEMCIRDRLAQERAAPLEGHAAVADERGDLPEEFLDLLLAVSYTHLTLPTICSV